MSRAHPRRINSRRARGGRGRGFSLLELVVVLSVVGILSSLVLPVFVRSISSMRVQNAQNDFVAALAFAQERAVSESREYRVYLDPRENAYWIARHVGFKGDEKIFEPVEERFGAHRHFPDRIELERPRARRDRAQDNAYYIACYPSGATDRTTLRFRDTLDRRRMMTVRTEGVAGRIAVEVR